MRRMSSTLLLAFLVATITLSYLPLPTHASPSTLTLSPSGDDSVEWDIFPTSPTTHYDKVLTADEDTTYVYTSVDPENDLFTLTDTSQTGTLNSVTVWARVKTLGNERIKMVFKTYGNVYATATSISLTTSYADYSEARTVNPYTTFAWTWTEVNALIAGVRHDNLGGAGQNSVTMVWVVVDYTVEGVTKNFYGIINQQFTIAKIQTWTFAKQTIITLNFQVVGIAEFQGGQIENFYGIISLLATITKQLQWSFNRYGSVAPTFTSSSTKDALINLYKTISERFTVDEANSWLFNLYKSIAPNFQLVGATEFLTGQIENFYGIISLIADVTEKLEWALNRYGSIIPTFTAASTREMLLNIYKTLNPRFTLKTLVDFTYPTIVDLFGRIISKLRVLNSPPIPQLPKIDEKVAGGIFYTLLAMILDYQGAPMPNVTVTVYRIDKTIAAQGVTYENGSVTFDLQPDYYYFVAEYNGQVISSYWYCHSEEGAVTLQYDYFTVARGMWERAIAKHGPLILALVILAIAIIYVAKREEPKRFKHVPTLEGR